MFAAAKYINPEGTVIEAEKADGTRVNVPKDPGNADYRLLIDGDTDLGIDPTPTADFVAPPVVAADVDAEVDRRASMAMLNAERAKLKPAADALKKRIKAGEKPDLSDDALWRE